MTDNRGRLPYTAPRKEGLTAHAGADQRKDRCYLNQDGEADRRSLTESHKKTA